MATNDIATLGIRVDPQGAVSGARKAKKSILGIGKAAKTVKSSIFSLQGAIAAIGVGALVKNVVQTSASLESLKIRLKTVTGSTENAAIAFNMLTDFTTRTPYEINEVATAFTKLKAYGLAPTEKSLTSFGNTASAMGKSLDQMIEAVADAATGEFERLKEFGIKSKTEGDRVKFTFQGVTTEVGKNAAEIKGYLEELGNTTFAGAMKDQMDTLDGAMSNLRGSFTLFTDEMLAQGTFDLIKGSVNEAAKALFGANGSLSENAQKAGISLAENLGGAAVLIADGFSVIRFISADISAAFSKTASIVLQISVLIDKELTDMVNGFTTKVNDLITWINKAKSHLVWDPIELFQLAEYNMEDINALKAINDELVTDIAKSRDAWTNMRVDGDNVQNWIDAVLAKSKETRENIESAVESSGGKLAEAGLETPLKESVGLETPLKESVGLETPLKESIGLKPFEMNFDTTGVGGFNDQLNDLMGTVGDLDTVAVGMIGNFADGLSTQLTEALMTGKASFGDFARSILAMIAQMIIKMLIFKAISGLVKAFAGPSLSGTGQSALIEGASMPAKSGFDMGSFLGKAAGGRPKAAGGRVKGGSPIMVGEQGRELFVPDGNGMIMANNKMAEKAGNEAQVVNVTLNLSTGVQSTVRAEIMGMMPIITKQVKNSVAEARQRGGSFSSRMGVA